MQELRYTNAVQILCAIRFPRILGINVIVY